VSIKTGHEQNITACDIQRSALMTLDLQTNLKATHNVSVTDGKNFWSFSPPPHFTALSACASSADLKIAADPNPWYAHLCCGGW